VCLTRIFDHRDVLVRGGGENRVEIGDRASQVNRHDNLRSIRDRRGDLARVDLKCLEVGVDKHRERVPEQYCVDRGDKGVGWDDHFVARAHVQGAQRCQQRAGAIGGRQAVRRPCEAGVFGLEALDLRAAVPPAAADHIGQRLVFDGVAHWPCGKRRRAHRRTTQGGRLGAAVAESGSAMSLTRSGDRSAAGHSTKKSTTRQRSHQESPSRRIRRPAVVMMRPSDRRIEGSWAAVIDHRAAALIAAFLQDPPRGDVAGDVVAVRGHPQVVPNCARA
jgi:hypothetical protein